MDTKATKVIMKIKAFKNFYILDFTLANIDLINRDPKEKELAYNPWAALILNMPDYFLVYLQ